MAALIQTGILATAAIGCKTMAALLRRSDQNRKGQRMEKIFLAYLSQLILV